MKIHIFLVLFCLCITTTFAGTIEKTYLFRNYSIQTTGVYSTVSFENTMQTGKPGEPLLPYQAVSLLLPPGESALAIDLVCENETEIPGNYILFPKQYDLPISLGNSTGFLKKENIYQSNNNYPSSGTSHLVNQFLNGYSFALSTFTPIRYNPSTGKVSYYQKITVIITTAASDKTLESLKNLLPSADISQNRVREFAQNPELTGLYPAPSLKQSSYDMMIITPAAFQDQYSNLITHYSSVGLDVRVVTTESIYSYTAGFDNQDKIRNRIIQEYQNNNINYVLLGGGAQYVPFRGFYCYVQSGSGYTDSNIPADLYYSGMDGNFDANGNHIFGEVDDQPDLLPDVAVGRFPFSTSQELAAMIHKTISYQSNPVAGELKRAFFAGEFLTNDPPTWGGDYLNLLINDHNDYGYFTHGIPEAINTIEKMYDTPYYSWDKVTLINKLNQGKPFIHHLGHSSTEYMLRMETSDITNENFYQLNGTTHNYPILYTQGCYCGAFDEDNCIAVKSVTIENFLVAGIFNSRYGWFNQGFTDGPSQHLQREFVSALFTDTLPEKHIGATHMISKIKTAPWVTAPEEFEPGAQRWCHYCSNVLGDPALLIWTDDPEVGIGKERNPFAFSLYPNPASDIVFVSCTLPVSSDVQIELVNPYGQRVSQLLLFKNQSAGDHTFSVQLPGLSQGIYFLNLKTQRSQISGKLMIMK